MSSLIRILLFGFSGLLVSNVGLAEQQSARPGVTYRIARSVIDLVSNPPAAGQESLQPVGADESDAVLENIEDFFLDEADKKSKGEPASDDAEGGDSELSDDSSEGKSDDSESEKDESKVGKFKNEAEKTSNGEVDAKLFSLLPSIRTISIDQPVSPGILPKNYAATAFESRATEYQSAGYVREGHEQTGTYWKAPWVAYHPLYFEDVWLERHGRDYGHLQPLVSAANFYGRIPVMPYMAGATPCRECVFSYGLGRPGDCPPHFFTVPKKSCRGMLYQSAYVTYAALISP